MKSVQKNEKYLKKRKNEKFIKKNEQGKNKFQKFQNSLEVS